MPAGAAAAMMGVVDSTAPGGTIISLPFTDAFTRSDGVAGQPWYSARCVKPLTVISDKLSVDTTDTVPAPQLGLLLNVDDFDLTFDVTYATADGHRQDLQVAFRASPCWSDTVNYYLWTTQPNVASGGGHVAQVFHWDGTSFTSLASGGNVLEGTSYTYRIRVHGTTIDAFQDGNRIFTATISALAGQRGLSFIDSHIGCTIDNVSITAPTYATSDNFNRADNPSSLGGDWTALVGGWGISSNQAYRATGAAGSFNFVVMDTALGDGTIQADVPVFWGGPGNNGGLGIAFRVTDANNLYLADFGSTAPALYKRVGGTFTNLGSFSGGVLASGDQISVVVSGTSIVCKRLRGGVLSTLLSVTDSTYDNTHTKHGFYMFSQDSTSRLDNFSIS